MKWPVSDTECCVLACLEKSLLGQKVFKILPVVNKNIL